jgi:hypothetical protein
MPVTEPDVPPFLIAYLEPVEEKPKLRFRWQAPTLIGRRVCRETIVISNDWPKASYLHPNRAIESANLIHHGEHQIAYHYTATLHNP